MTPDERATRVVVSWLETTVVDPPPATRSVGRVMDLLPETTQLERRRWLPAFKRTEARGSVPRPAPVEHDRIPAPSAARPTVIWRTQTMFSPVKAIAAGALVFSIGAALLVAQPFDRQTSSTPGAAPGDPTEAVEFTARFPWGPETAQRTTEMLASGVVEQVGWVHETSSSESSDPRFEGTMIYTCNLHLYPAGQGRMFDCVHRVENDEGAWQSRPSLQIDFGDGGFGPFSIYTAVFDGEGGYEGLTAVVEVTEVSPTGYDLHGLIVDGSLPPHAEHADAG